MPLGDWVVAALFIVEKVELLPLPEEEEEEEEEAVETHALQSIEDVSVHARTATKAITTGSLVPLPILVSNILLFQF